MKHNPYKSTTNFQKLNEYQNNSKRKFKSKAAICIFKQFLNIPNMVKNLKVDSTSMANVKICIIVIGQYRATARRILHHINRLILSNGSFLCIDCRTNRHISVQADHRKMINPIETFIIFLFFIQQITFLLYHFLPNTQRHRTHSLLIYRPSKSCVACLVIE